MWGKSLIIFIIFYLLTLLQASFFAQINIFGAVPNLVFILFFLLIFFYDSEKNLQPIAWSIMAGFFLDINSASYFGTSIILLLIINFVIKNLKKSLKQTDQDYPIFYFLPMFLLFFVSYEFSINLILYFLKLSGHFFVLNLKFLVVLISNSVFSVLGFYIFKKFNFYSEKTRQLKLFK